MVALLVKWNEQKSRFGLHEKHTSIQDEPWWYGCAVVSVMARLGYNITSVMIVKGGYVKSHPSSNTLELHHH